MTHKLKVVKKSSVFSEVIQDPSLPPVAWTFPIGRTLVLPTRSQTAAFHRLSFVPGTKIGPLSFSIHSHKTKAELDEDSSYDSDTEAVASPHQNVSRNVSETLAQELIEEFNSVSFCIFRHHHHRRPIPDLQRYWNCCCFFIYFFLSARTVCFFHVVFSTRLVVQPNYRQYLEFALKLGYSERLVQLALGRLENPTNNELLAALIKLGAQPGSNGSVVNKNSASRFFSYKSRLFLSFVFQRVISVRTSVAPKRMTTTLCSNRSASGPLWLMVAMSRWVTATRMSSVVAVSPFAWTGSGNEVTET